MVVFDEWINDASASEVPELRSAAKTFKRNRDGILAYWSSGGMNNAATKGFSGYVRRQGEELRAGEVAAAQGDKRVQCVADGEEAKSALDYLDKRRDNMHYGWLTIRTKFRRLM